MKSQYLLYYGGGTSVLFQFFRSFLFTVGPHRVSGSKTTQALPPSQQVRVGPWHQGAPQLSSQHSLVLRQGYNGKPSSSPFPSPKIGGWHPSGIFFILGMILSAACLWKTTALSQCLAENTSLSFP